MIPILYSAFERDFDSFGFGKLTDCTACSATEERHNIYEVTFKYPVSGIHFSDIQEGRIIFCTHEASDDCQPFEIYRRSANIDGIVQFWARHISYRLSKVVARPFTAETVGGALTKLKTETFNDNNFDFWTNKETIATFKVQVPSSVRSVLGGVEGSILDVYGGEYKFDKYTVKLYNNRGSDNGVTVRYGKNLTKFTQTLNAENLYNAIVPYWSDYDGNVVYGNPVMSDNGIFEVHKWTDENDVVITDENDNEMEFTAYVSDMTPMDFSDRFQEAPTPKQLEDLAREYMIANAPWELKENLKFNFVSLRQTEEYADVAPLEDVKLCDMVTVQYPDYEISVKAKVIKTVWNVLEDRYDSIEIGNPRDTFQSTISTEIHEAVKDRPTVTEMTTAISNATDLLTGGMGGHLVYRFDENGKPTEMFMMDTDDVNTARNVWRLNVNGIGFSSNGINGQFRTAWLLDGSFDATFITAGILSANRIRAGVLSSADGKSYWDLDKSKFRFYDQAFDSYVELDEGYIDFAHGGESFGRIIRRLNGDAGGDVLAIEGSSRETFIVLFEHMIRLWSENDYFQFNGNEHFTQVHNNSSNVRVYDNADYQFIDFNSGGDTYIRVDGKTDKITMKHNNLVGLPVFTSMSGGFAEIKRIYLSKNDQNTPFLMCESADGNTYFVTLTQLS